LQLPDDEEEAEASEDEEKSSQEEEASDDDAGMSGLEEEEGGQDEGEGQAGGKALGTRTEVYDEGGTYEVGGRLCAYVCMHA
jgi:hypothetical protein